MSLEVEMSEAFTNEERDAVKKNGLPGFDYDVPIWNWGNDGMYSSDLGYDGNNESRFVKREDYMELQRENEELKRKSKIDNGSVMQLQSRLREVSTVIYQESRRLGVKTRKKFLDPKKESYRDAEAIIRIMIENAALERANLITEKENAELRAQKEDYDKLEVEHLELKEELGIYKSMISDVKTIALLCGTQ